MVYTSARPVSVDGVRLDTLAWNIEKIDRATASRRSGDYDIPNLDGVVPSLNDALEPASYGLQMWLRGTDADGAVPGAGSLTTLRNNLDELLHLFGKRHALLDLREVVDGTGTERRAWAKVNDAIQPDLNAAGSAGRFTVGMTLPYGVWEDVAASDFTQVTPTTGSLVALQGATERVNDAVFLVEGPVTNPRITDQATGMWVELAMVVPAGGTWRFNSATWSSRTSGAILSLADSGEASGTDRAGITTTGGPSRAYGLPLTPIREDGTRKVRAYLSGSGITNGTTKLTTRTRRKYAA